MWLKYIKIGVVIYRDIFIWIEDSLDWFIDGFFYLDRYFVDREKDRDLFRFWFIIFIFFYLVLLIGWGLGSMFGIIKVVVFFLMGMGG